MSISVREARAIIRKAKRRVAEGEEISHLNITAMMDMMTILLVFMIKSMATQTSALELRDVSLPPSTTRLAPPEEAVKVTIARSAILVEGEPVVAVKNGDVDPSEKTLGQFGTEIGKVRKILSQHHARITKIATQRGEEPAHELTIIADRDTPYRLLYAVIYSAGQAAAEIGGKSVGPGFTNYRLIVLRKEE